MFHRNKCVFQSFKPEIANSRPINLFEIAQNLRKIETHAFDVLVVR